MADQSVETTRRSPPPRQPITLSGAWNNVTLRSWFYQFIVIAGVIAFGAYLIGNAQSALARQNISTGYHFLWQSAGFDIGERLIPFTASDTFLRAYVVGVLNTLKVALASIVFATLIGIVVGVGRLSPNLLVRKLSSIYVEIFRNTPQLVQIIFWYTVIVTLPRPRDAISIGDFAFISNRGLTLPWVGPDFPVLAFTMAIVGGCFAAWALMRWARARRRATGNHRPILLPALALSATPLLLAIVVSGASLTLSVPELRGFNFQGGVAVSTEFLALSLGLSLYIAAFVAEIVRSGIQSVRRGQIEAARSIGLGSFDTYRKVVFPQALRVMVPPAAGQYVSVVKNSSLGVAIGYPELFNVNNTIITLSGHTVEAIVIMMSIYLSISFLIAILMNVYNRSVQIRER